jgi:hypothetical protein
MDDNKQEVKLYAGKFKTIEDLEEGYKNSLPTFQENENLKKRVDELSFIPDSYLNPSDIDIDQARISDIQARAREAGMTQQQYEKFLRSDKSRLDQHKQRFEESKKELGDQTLNVLKDYVERNYPKELQDNMMNTFIGNKEARQAALRHRDQLLNNQVPGVSKMAPANSYRVTDEDVNKAYLAKEKNKGDMKARQHYMNILEARAAQNASS